MSAPTLTSAIAAPFAWTSAGTDLTLTFPAGASPVNVTLPSATYYVCLAASTSDVLRVLASAINAAVAGAGRSEVFTLTLGADGYVTLASTGVFSVSGVPNALKLLGFSTAITSALSATATYPPAYLATFVERVSADWTPRTAVSGAETLAGVGYGVASGSWREEDDIAFGYVPRDPTQRTSLGVNQSPWMPDGNWSASPSLPTVWTCRDLLAVSLAQTLHVALGNLQTLRTSTSARYDLCTIPATEISTPRKERVRDGWDAYFRWTVKMLRQSTQTGTRA